MLEVVVVLQSVLEVVVVLKSLETNLLEQMARVIIVNKMSHMHSREVVPYLHVLGPRNTRKKRRITDSSLNT